MATTRTARAAGESTRVAILDAARSVFAAKGFSASSVEDVAQAAGVSRPTVLYHFAGKTALLEAVLTRRDEDVEIMQPSPLDPAPTPAQDLLRVVRYRSTAIRAELEAMKLAHLIEAEAANEDHPAREWVSGRNARIRVHFDQAFASVQSSSISSESLASLLLAVVQGLEAQWLVDPDGVDVDGALAAFETLVERAFDLPVEQ